ncbi:MAG: hypothetical protein HWE22_07485 [Flavobacteriales bacterium]|nr:hypothetical protein [Flavobacteriales bacterium]
MPRRKQASFTFKRLIVITTVFICLGFVIWYFFGRSSTSPVNIQPLPEGFLSHGIDISHHQGEIDWDEFTEKMDTTISFVYCKVTEGNSFTDHRWTNNQAALKRNKIKHGGYHFLSPDLSGKTQANYFLKHYDTSQGNLPPVLDAEVEALTDEILISNMKEWLHVVEQRLGIRPIIYTSYSLYRDKMKGKFPNHQFWIASYNPDESRVQDPAIIHWQYSDRGQIPGISGAVDLNFSKIDYRPKLEQLERVN